MKNISASDWSRIQSAHGDLVSVKNKIENFISNMQVELDKLIEDANSIREDAFGALDDIYNEAQNYYDERSEKWQDSDAGQQYSDWVSELDEARNALDVQMGVSLDDAVADDINSIDEMIGMLDGGFRQSPDE